MRNPEQTKITILEGASTLFNTKGYKATSLSDITAVTKLTKGAIYRHFHDKADLEKQALLYMLNLMMGEMTRTIKRAPDAPSKLNAVLNYFDQYRKTPPFNGGCPLMNAAVESDDSNDALKFVVRDVMIRLHESISIIINNGIKHEQIKKEIDVASMSSLFFSAIEGGIMLMKIMDDDQQLASVIKYLRKEISNIQK